MMSGTAWIVIGICLIAIGTGIGTFIIILGQSKNNQQETNRLIMQNKTAQKAIDAQSAQI